MIALPPLDAPSPTHRAAQTTFQSVPRPSRRTRARVCTRRPLLRRAVRVLVDERRHVKDVPVDHRPCALLRRVRVNLRVSFHDR